MPFAKRTFILLVCLLAAPVAWAQTPPWNPLGPFGGTVDSITADPVTPGVLYAATNVGLYKTTDAGGSWTAIYTGPLSGGHLAVDPLRPSTLYLTGAVQDPVVLKSVDSGAHWSRAVESLPNYYSILAVDPARPRRLYLGSAGGGLWRSVDAGASWQPEDGGLPEPVYVQAIAPASRPAGKVLIATQRGVYRSTDGGATWSAAGGLPQSYAYAVAFAPSDPRTAYAYLAGSGAGGAGYLYRSTDGGVSWRRVLKTGGSSVVREISISPLSPRLLYARCEDRALYRSADGGDHWTLLQSRATAVAADPFAAATVWSSLLTGSNFGGVWRSADQGKTWAERSRGITGVGVTSLAIDRDDPDRLWIVAFGAPLRSTDNGAHWTRMRTPPGESGIVKLAAGAASRVFALAYKVSSSPSSLPTYSLWRTADDGSSWARLPVPSSSIYTFRLAPSNPSTLYVVEASLSGAMSRLLRSTDGGAHWESWPQTALSCGLGDLQVAPSVPTIVYLGGCKASHAAAVLRSGDGGATFSDVATGGGPPGSFVQTLAVDPREPNVVWAGTGGLYDTGDGVWKSVEGGAWTRAGSELAGLTITALLAPDVPGRVYAASLDGRIFRSDDGGATWDDWTDGLPPSRVYSLEAAPDDPRRIYAVTTRGIWLLNEAD